MMVVALLPSHATNRGLIRRNTCEAPGTGPTIRSGAMVYFRAAYCIHFTEHFYRCVYLAYIEQIYIYI